VAKASWQLSAAWRRGGGEAENIGVRHGVMKNKTQRKNGEINQRRAASSSVEA